jgi:hypothetical protein
MPISPPPSHDTKTPATILLGIIFLSSLERQEQVSLREGKKIARQKARKIDRKVALSVFTHKKKASRLKTGKLFTRDIKRNWVKHFHLEEQQGGSRKTCSRAKLSTRKAIAIFSIGALSFGSPLENLISLMAFPPTAGSHLGEEWNLRDTTWSGKSKSLPVYEP